MYLKSIEIQGFKSFANKILFQFHNGITGIVGPNGSGKSNVADAVRWVLGEQSAKQLRGTKMEDVIFAGTELRKPLSYAYVSITFDNSDHVLDIDYDEVKVTRKVFRSGESEYQINGNSCRLKDISELFYDTGIGKEGYSIIGQGQIDKILSGKPDERRELFDEAAGIVKFKRRKAASIKKLENEKDNLVRVNDILSELEKQVGPLKEQSEKARKYLNLRDDLKVRDVNAFLIESDQLREKLADVSTKIDIVSHNMSEAKEKFENTNEEYERLEAEIEEINQEIDESNTSLTEANSKKQEIEGDIKVCIEQVNAFNKDKENAEARIQAITNDLDAKNKQIEDYNTESQNLDQDLYDYQESLKVSDGKTSEYAERIDQINAKLLANQNEIYSLMEVKSKGLAEIERLKAMSEQLGIRKAELSSQILAAKSLEADQDQIILGFRDDLIKADENVNAINSKIKEINDSIQNKRNQISALSTKAEKLQSEYHRAKSRLESLVAITEKYDGYGNSIKKVMELKSQNPGILGVIADIVKVEKKYETAIETALGGAIQNIVTDNENTAKNLISYLKQNRLGRATFLPLNAINARNTLNGDACTKEKGAIGVANKLVRVSYEYEKLIDFLLGRILVVDNIDNALAIARKYKHSLRIVTLEGEQLNPGGSMTGGAFKNAGNLLGRRREIEELKVEVNNSSKEFNESKEAASSLRKEVSDLRLQLDEENKVLRQAQVDRNTAQMNLSNASSKKKEIVASYSDQSSKMAEVKDQLDEIDSSMKEVNLKAGQSDSKTEELKNSSLALTDELEKVKKEQTEYTEGNANIRLAFETISQKKGFILENVSRLKAESQTLIEEKEELKAKISQALASIKDKNDQIELLKEESNNSLELNNDLSQKINQLKLSRDEKNKNHKQFLDLREDLRNQIGDLDKESYRLSDALEKYQETQDNLVDYMWQEYELTYNYALELKNPEFNDLNAMKKEIRNLKNSIRALGPVNVNSVEQYNEVSERYEFLKKQHDDLIEATDSLKQVIDDLDAGMRKQFTEKFEEIKLEFSKVFKELFGGGKGTIRLDEEADILDANITIESQPPGKKLQNMMQLSGGEKALTAISLLFAIQNLKPSPFCLLDEIEAALDDSNVGRYANYLHKLTAHTQFIVITHRRGTMTAADRLYGITMQEKGVSTLVSVDLIEADLDDKPSK